MSRRAWHVDAAKVVASNLIVLHHLTAYGPVADGWDIAATAFTDWIFEYGRMAVQVFLVIGGYLAAAALAPDSAWPRQPPWKGWVKRYLRLVLPLAAALLLTMLSSAIARHWFSGDFVPAAPGLLQFAAHIALIQGPLAMEPLSVGLWYVAMDFQLYCLMGLVLWVGGHYAQWLVIAMTLASLLYFNLYESGAQWAPYFFGAYGLGALAWWGQRSARPGRWMAFLLCAGLTALAWDFRIRIAIALATALCLLAVPWYQRMGPAPLASENWLHRTSATLVRSSYALFLVHFSVLLLGNVAYSQLPQGATTSMWVVVPTLWLACLAAAFMFERFVERPLARIRL